MRRTPRQVAAVSLALALAVALGGCGEGPTPGISPDPSTTEAAEPEPTPEPTATPTPEAPAVVTTLDPAAVLSAAAFGGDASTPTDVTETIDAWALPESCAAGAPATAVASHAVAYGDGEYESVVGIQQLAIFADAEVATAEAERVHAAAVACAAAGPDAPSIYVVEDVAVGAQGMAAGVDYYGTSATGSVDEAMGYFVVMTRRGNAVTIVGYVGGESNLGSSRENAMTTGQAAWELLCVYDSAGCPTG